MSEQKVVLNRRETTLERYKALIARARAEGQLDLVMRNLMLNDLFFLLIYGLSALQFANNDWVFDRCREFEADRDGYLDLWPREHFKDLPLDTPMLTQNRGWITHGDLVVGDRVFAPSGKAVEVLALSPRYHMNRCLKITFQDGKEITCGEGHLWRVRDITRSKRDETGYRATGRLEQIVEARNLEAGDDVGAIEGQLEYPEAALPVHPYVLGAWLGDGDSKAPRITCSYSDIDIPMRIASFGYEVKEGKPSDGRTGLYSFGGGTRGKKNTGVFPLFRALGVVKNKHIPRVYFESSIQQRTDLLHGLMDTDGSCNERGNASFCNSSERLARDVYELAVSLALRPRINFYWTTCNGTGRFHMWVVSFQQHSDRPTFSLHRKEKNAIKPSAHRSCRRVVSVVEADHVDTSCVQVEGGMYLAGRDLIPTHNSTIITLAGVIQEILRDQEITVGIFSFNRPAAKSFLRVIKNNFESNEKLKELFPDILYADPSKEAPKWSEDDGIVVKRKGLPKEMTVEAWGLVDGMPTGKHYRLMVYDDLVTKDSVTSPEMIAKVTESVSLSFNLGSIQGNRRWMVGTRYHMADTYSMMIKRGAVKLRLYGATSDGKFEGNPVLFSRKVLDDKIKDMGAYVASCQLFNNPVMEGEQTFNPDWIRTYSRLDWSRMNRYILVDPSGEKKKSSDYTVMAVIALGSDQNYYLVDMIRDKLSLQEKAQRLIALHAQYRPIGVGYEKYGMQSDIAYIKERQDRENYRFDITELKGSMPKNDRIRRLQPLFEEKRFYLPERLIRTDYQGKSWDLVQSFLNEEYLQFPYMTHDDMLDCMARIRDDDMATFFPRNTVSPEEGMDEDANEHYDFKTFDYLKQRKYA